MVWVVPGLVGEVVLGFGCFLSGRVRLFVGADLRFSAESRVVVAHLRVSLHYCVSLAWPGWCRIWWARWSWASDGFCRAVFALLPVQICALMQFHALLQRINAQICISA